TAKPPLVPVLDSLDRWLARPLPAFVVPESLGHGLLTARGPSIPNALAADLLDGLSSPEDPDLEAVFRALSTYLRTSSGPPPPPPPPPVVPWGSANLFAADPVWVAGQTGPVVPDLEARLGALATQAPTYRWVLADLDPMPDQLRAAGFNARDTAIWY